MASTPNVLSDTDVQGSLRCKTFTPPAGCIGDAAINAGANVAATKTQHRWRALFNQVHGSIATAERRAVFYAYATGTITFVRAGSVVACIGGATITIDVKKNGTSILTATIVLDNANTAYVVEAGSLSVTTLAIGDVLEVVQTVATGGGTLGQAVFVVVGIDEDAV